MDTTPERAALSSKAPASERPVNDYGLYLIMAAIVISSLGLGFGLSAFVCYKTKVALRTDLCAIPACERRVSLVESQVRMFLRLIEMSLTPRLHAPSNPELDGLLRKLVSGGINLEEAWNLHRLMQEHPEDIMVEPMPMAPYEVPRLVTLWGLETRLVMGGLSPSHAERAGGP